MELHLKIAGLLLIALPAIACNYVDILQSGTAVEVTIRGETQFNHGPGYYGTPYDSTQGVPDFVFIGFWILIILFLIRLGWEYRDEIFKKKG